MKIQAVVERDDGGADIIIQDMSPDEVQVVLQAGFVALMERLAKEESDKRKQPAIFRGNE